ncbi:MAG: hypothetical protein ACOCRX_12280 [Candidatus Woesearchaeota archaeon]
MDFRFARKKLKRGVLILESHQSFVNLELEFLSEYNSKDVKEIYDYWKNNKKRKNKNKFFTYKPGFNLLLNDSNTYFELKYPGYLTKFNSEKDEITRTDFRVDMIRDNERFILSHANIIVDLYSKSLDILRSYDSNKKDNIRLSNLQNYLIDIAINAANFDISKLDFLNKIEYEAPNKGIIDTVSEIHDEKDKNFSKKANHKPFNYEELAASIILISMQEDINYRISKGFQGRKMPFYRYLETIYCAYADFKNIDTEHNLEEVINRTLIKNTNTPELWENIDEIDYESINNLKDWTKEAEDPMKENE